MKRLIITEEEKSRILGMHKNAISKEFLIEGTGQGYVGTIQINDAPEAFKYFSSLARKNKKLDKGTAWLGKTTYWVVTEALADAGSAADTQKARLMMRGITKRDSFFDVTNDVESFNIFELAIKPTDAWLTNDNTVDTWVSKPQTIRANPDIKGTPGGNMALVGGLNNFKSMVKNLPDNEGKKYSGFLQKRAQGTLAPDKNYGPIPKDQWDLYPAPGATPTQPTTKTPTQPK